MTTDSLDRVLSALQHFAAQWSDGPEGDYGRALVDEGRFFPADARVEATQIAKLMGRDFLGGVLTSGGVRSLDDVERLREAASADSAVFVLGSGNIGLPVILNTLVALLLGRRVWVRTSRANRRAIQTWHAGLRAHPDPCLQRLAADVHQVGADPDAPGYGEVLGALSVESAYLWGGAEALETTRAALCALGDEQVHLFGPRTAAVLLEAGWWRAASSADRDEVAQAIYDNTLAWDAALCSSPTAGFLLGSPAEAHEVLSDLVSRVHAHADERERLERLPGAAARRRHMRQWRTVGYRLYSPPHSVVTFASGDSSSRERRARFFPDTGTYHDGAGSLEWLRYDPADAHAVGARIAALPHDPWYAGGLWSVAHLATAATPEVVEAVVEALEGHTPAERPHRMAAADLRVVDVRRNIGRAPGERYDGIDLVEAIAGPSSRSAG